ncbi:3-phosphoshikimate 1-carboxyvinyltransferase [Pedobacter sp. BAL39]|uniref:3-phosphoshikimate 1-carboxyvinyltransferase n=1 Tax=Pedobacter sp. BAL39 TaxID=391596 RepID=UPI00015593AF|nr:3-phosphoshikimate 1-carboxyvinyltransferase [Pedobacter sp. BAL39]EDM37644.1 3-phosphoshikimate 1-carboxyvinyltransferase [Pedobacter sp. BAL39]
MSKNAIVSFAGNKHIHTEITLTGSKSECNRALIISALSKGAVAVANMSIAADTVTLARILKQVSTHNPHQQTVDVGPAGTAMRFLTAFLSALPGDFRLTGTERMKQRPIGILSEALKTIGANISYLGEEGYPPLHINGPLNQSADTVKIKGDISSQYISALLMVAPRLPEGLTLEIEGELTSVPYVKMTLDMLTEAGISHEWSAQQISIKPQSFKATTLTVEPDWSAASYWYSIAALASESAIELPYLKEKSLQGDSRIREIMTAFGLHTSNTANGIALSKIPAAFTDEVLDLKDCPDLAQTVIVCAAAMKKNLAFTGLETLKIKETDRIKALQNELAKIGVTLTEDHLVYTLNCDGLHFPERVTFATYEDHRMAMAFAPLSLLINEVVLEEMDVVEKSYPDFWKDLQTAGFTVITA